MTSLSTVAAGKAQKRREGRLINDGYAKNLAPEYTQGFYGNMNWLGSS